MRTRRRNLLLAVLVAVVAMTGLAWVIFRDRELVFKEKTLISLLVNYGSLGLHVPDEQAAEGQQNEIDEAVRQIGTNAIPILLKWLQTKDGPFKQKVVKWFERHPLLHVRALTDFQKNEMALFGFKILGPIAKPAVPNLIDVLEHGDSDQKSLATMALGRIGPEAHAAVPALMNYLKGLEPADQTAAKYALEEIDKEAAVKAGIK